MLPEYRYQCVDRSILVPYLKRWVVGPLSRITPQAVPANLITLGTNSFMYVALIFAAHAGPAWKANFVLLPLSMFIYAVGDHLDGWQAKRTGTGSPLGEFCDHYLDAFNTGIVTYFALAIFQVEHKIAVPLVFLCVYAANAGILYEELRTGWLRFERFGSLEGVALVMALIFAGLHPQAYEWITTPLLPWNGTVMLVMVSGTALGGVMTVVTSLRRGGPSVRFFVFLGLGVILAFYAHAHLNTWRTFVLFCLYGAHYSGSLLHAHLVTRREPMADFVVPLAGLAVLLGVSEPAWGFGACMAYLVARNMLVTLRTFSALREFWYWKNPQPAHVENR